VLTRMDLYLFAALVLLSLGFASSCLQRKEISNVLNCIMIIKCRNGYNQLVWFFYPCNGCVDQLADRNIRT
jgi:hypothetical protein